MERNAKWARQAPLDLATERWKKLGIEKEKKNKETLKHVLNIMEPSGKWKKH